MTGTFEGVGSLQFTPDNKFAYAYSGSIDVDENEITLIEERTNSEYIVAQIQFNNLEEDDVEDYLHKIYLNDVVVQGFIQGRTDYDNKYESAIPIIIPPFTTFKLTSQNITNTESHAEVVSLTGSVHGAIEQENLEAITNNNKWAEKGPF